MKENKTKPDIRFKGFTDDWEQRKLRDEAIEILAGGDINKEKTVENGKYPIYANALTNDGIVGYYDDYYRVTAPAVTVTGRGEVGYAKARMTHFTPVVRLLAVCSNHDCYFLENAINNHKVVVESTGVPQLTVPQLSSYNIFFPANGKEEVRIGKYFHTLDNLITLHQRECNQLKELKKTMLKKMFPRDGSNIPEVRFAGFTDDWEQRKLGELLEKYEDPVETPHDGYERLGIRSHAKGTFHSFVESGEELNSARMHRVAANKFILNITFAWEHAVAITDKNDEGKLVSHRFPQFSFDKCLKSNFFKYLILDEKFRKHLELSSPGGAGRNRVLKISDMLEYKIYLPSIDEQTEIGQYFSHLDNLITLHQRELEILKNLKKTCLKRMFI